MIKTTGMLLDELSNYRAPYDKIASLCASGALYPVIKGIYETDPTVPGYLLAPVIYSPSYLSFDYALSRHGLIPERVQEYTSATCSKGKKKLYNNGFGCYSFRDIPAAAYPCEIELREENGYAYFIASPEKAICDKLYICPTVANRKQLELLLFDDLRIDRSTFNSLNATTIAELDALYRCKNIHHLNAYMHGGRV